MPVLLSNEPDAWAPPAGAIRRTAALRRATELAPFLDNVQDVLADLGYPRRDLIAVRLALEEAVVNGLRHGNGGDAAKRVWVCCRLAADAVLADVEDEGPGFDPAGVADPTRPENLALPGGRGLLLIRHFMDKVRFSGRGNRVTMYKRRSD